MKNIYIIVTVFLALVVFVKIYSSYAKGSFEKKLEAAGFYKVPEVKKAMALGNDEFSRILSTHVRNSHHHLKGADYIEKVKLDLELANKNKYICAAAYKKSGFKPDQNTHKSISDTLKNMDPRKKDQSDKLDIKGTINAFKDKEVNFGSKKTYEKGVALLKGTLPPKELEKFELLSRQSLETISDSDACWMYKKIIDGAFLLKSVDEQCDYIRYFKLN